MHNNNTVVSLYALNGSRKTPLREYDHKRGVLEPSVRVPLKFGSEYGIGFKFQDLGRRRLELWIDGAMVTDNLILDGGESFLERFMDSDKRFRFVAASDAAVADPTSPSNGGIVVKLWREQPTYPTFKDVPQDKQWPTPPTTPWQPWTPPVVWCQSQTPEDPLRSFDVMCGDGQYSSDSSINIKGLRGSGDLSLCYDSSSLADGFSSVSMTNQSISDNLKGATVEGSTSKQTFNDTVWLGDFGSPLIFKFQLHGIEEVKQGNFCPGCGIKRKNPTNFCPNCGAKQ